MRTSLLVRTAGPVPPATPWTPSRRASLPGGASSTRLAAGTARARAARAATGSSSRSPFEPMPPPRITSSGSTTDATATIASAIRCTSAATTRARLAIAATRLVEHLLRGQRRRHPQPPGVGHHAGRAGRGVERAAAAARRIAQIGLRQREVADLARRPGAAAVELAVQDHAHADARAQVQVDEVLDALAEPLPLFADRRQVHVVLERDLGPQLLLDQLDQPLPPPPGQRVGQRDLTALLLEDPGAPHGRERHLAPLDARVRCQARARSRRSA